jgi:ribosomal protein L18E
VPVISQALYVRGQAVPPYVGEWLEISRQRYPDADQDWDDAQLITAEAKTGEQLSLYDALAIEQMVREKIVEDGGAPLESRILSRLERLPSGQEQFTYKVEHAAHGSPIVWAVVIAFIAANWKAILIVIGVAALVVAAITFTIKAVNIIWKAGGKVEDFIEEAPPALITGLGLGIALLALLFVVGTGRKKESAA